MLATDLDLCGKDIGDLTSPDAIAAFLAKLGYRTTLRTALTPESIGLAGDSADAFKKIELLSEDEEGFLRVVFAQPKSLTAKARNDLARVLGRTTIDHLLILASDYETLEFVLLDKRKKEQQGPIGGERVQVVPKIISVSRRVPSRLDLRAMRQFTWTRQDGLEQFDKLRSVFTAAAYTGDYFQNRGLFSDYFLRERLREDPAWKDSPAAAFAYVRDLFKNAQGKWQKKEKEIVRAELYKPLFERLGFRPQVNRPSRTDQTEPDYLLKDASGRVLTAAFVYQWDRWLDGPDLDDPDTPDENPGACVVSALDKGLADWIVVTNGRLWRLYGRHAHARSTNFYEVDLLEALTASGDTDPNEAFRYFWLFFRSAAFLPQREEGTACWLDDVLTGCRDYAKRLGDRLKERIFYTIFPHLAQGFLADQRARLGARKEPTEQELADIYEATLTLLYRLLFLLYAESRDLLPVREAPYREKSLKRLKEEVSERAGVAEADVSAQLEKAYSRKETALYDRITDLCRAMDKGDPVLNVPTYNGGLFITDPDDTDRREQRIARFLLEHKVPDLYLALALDRLARDQDERTFALVFIDYKSLEVRHLGSIYEGLLEFKLLIADEDKTTLTDKKGERYVALSEAKPKRGGKPAEVKIAKGRPYLSNDKAERKASGSYYTPDPIVEHIVANTVGAVLDQKLEALRPEFRKVRKTFDQELQKSKAYPSAPVRNGEVDHRQWAADQTYLAHKDLVEKFFDLKVLDPALGSGHFLVEAVDFITDRLLKFLNQFPINPVNIALDRTRSSILRSLGEQGVTVDPAKLTDINLLKRHVLKRCIYGVDLNPMAVELAKVSLWLDAFTLGAPLSFLDHHLRCGNSLVGATFLQLEAATANLFALNTEPLLRAINHVLFVSKMADATAAEASDSARQYARAREALSGYRVIFDCLVARHFGEPEAAGIVERGVGYDLGNREKFLQSVTDAEDRRLIERVEALAQRPDRRFFHWEVEFPEVFFGYMDANQRQIRHKDKITPGSAGFDVVIGNPPWGQKELTTDDTAKRYIWEQYHSTRGIFDLFRAFLERGIRLLRGTGLVGMVLPDIILLKDYVETRRYLLDTLALRRIDWWGMAFEDAVIDSVTLIGAMQPAPEGHEVWVKVHDPEKPIEQLIPQADFRGNPRFVFNLFLTPEKRRALGQLGVHPKLGDYFEIHEGVHSGNIRADLFVDQRVDSTCRELYFGRDEIEPYCLRWNGGYIRLGALPAKKNKDCYANAGQPEWYDRTKILVRRTGDYILAAVDESRRYASNNFFLVFPKRECPLDCYGLVGLLNSRFMTTYFRTIEPRQGRVFAELKIKHLSVFPLPAGGRDGSECARLNELGRRRSEVASLIALGNGEAGANLPESVACLDMQIETCVRALFGLGERCSLDAE